MAQVSARRQLMLQFNDDQRPGKEGNLGSPPIREGQPALDPGENGEGRTTVAGAEPSPDDESLTDTGSGHRAAAGSSAFEKLVQYFDADGYRYRVNDGNQSLAVNLRGETGAYLIVARVDDEAALFQVFGYASIRIPEGSRPAIAETVARANYGLRVGKFELDLDEGELRFQASQVLTDAGLEDRITLRLIDTTMSMLDRYLPAVLSVIYGNELPQDAIRCVSAGRCGHREPKVDEREATD